MKILILGLIFCSVAQASSLGQYYSSPEGTSLQKFNISTSKIELEKLSNFFDKNRDFSLGKFSTTRTLKEDQLKLEEILKKIQAVDKFLKNKNSSFNELSTKVPHESFLVLDDYRVSKESDLYPELKAIYERLSALEWKQVSGIKLSDDYKFITTIKGGKESSRGPFDMSFHCQKMSAPTVCGYKDLGILYLK